MTEPFVWLYRVEDAEWLDPWDNPHRAIKVLELMRAVDAGTFPKNNGYYDYEARVVVHAESGRTWWKPQTIDYWGTEHWVRERLMTGESTPERWIDRWSPRTRVLWADHFPWSPDGQGCKVPEDWPVKAESCGAWPSRGGCTMPKGHNRGQADVPSNHQFPDRPTPHGKGRDCVHTEEVLENYRQRALSAERVLAEHGAQWGLP